ncbi:MAG: UvrD-helicase domain-containing protein, partial [Plesiomonas sp.]
MKLTATRLGRRLSQHPYHSVEVVNDALCFRGSEPASPHRVVPFRQLLALETRRGIVWGELQVLLTDGDAITLHGTDWHETRQFCAELENRWQQWTQDMLPLVLQALTQAGGPLISRLKALRWLAQDELQQIQRTIRQAWQALPIAPERVACLDTCAEPFGFCQRWLDEGEELTRRYNQQFIERLRQQEFDLFGGCLPSAAQPTASQLEALLLNEPRVLVQGIAGSGKTHIAAARAAWLMQQEGVQPQQMLLLAGAATSRDLMLQVLRATLGQEALLPAVLLHHELAGHIVAQADSRRLSELNPLETDTEARCAFWIVQWQRQCSEKAAQAKGWAQWLGDELGWSLSEGEFWQDPALCARLSSRLDGWLTLLRRQQGSQKSWLEALVDAKRQPELQKKLRLLNPLLKAWRSHLKEARTQDSLTLQQQAHDLLAAGRYVSLFTHLICDDFQL